MTTFFPILTSRQVALRAPDMNDTANHPETKTLSDEQICLYEAFCRYLARTLCTDVNADYVCTFAILADLTPERLRLIASAVRVFRQEYAKEFEAAAKRIEAIHARRRVHKGPKRNYERSVSVSPEELPPDWQGALNDMKNGTRRGIAAPAPSIQTRLAQRLGMFAWSARQVGLPVDLGNSDALRAFFTDLEERSAAKYGGGPREATLRNSFEELHRFARYMEMPENVLKPLRFTYDILCIAEGEQDQLKWKKIDGHNSDEILVEAADRLRRADTKLLPEELHKLRNEAMALIVGFYVVPRPADFVAFKFGETVFYNEDRKAYSFIYLQQKTRHRVGIKRKVHLPPSATPYIDAVIMHGTPPDMLPFMRAKAMHDKRPLTVHDDGDPVAYGWYSRLFVDVIGTGGHAMRSIRAKEILQKYPNAIGIEIARKTIGHASDVYLNEYLPEEIRVTCISEAKSKLRASWD